MKVEVSIVKRPGTSASNCQVRCRRKGFCVQIPVRVVRPEFETEHSELPVDEGFPGNIKDNLLDVSFCADANENNSNKPDLNGYEDNISADVDDFVSPEPHVIGFAASPDHFPSAENTPDTDLDEEELLAMIAEEEAEMMAALTSSEEPSSLIPEDTSVNNSSGPEDEEPLDMIDEDEVAPSPLSPDKSDETDSLQSEEEDILEGFDKVAAAEFFDDVDDSGNSDPSNDQPASSSHYVRYFDRSTSGERVEVETSDATGQEIVCVDEQSGRISRVCGFIRNNSHAAEDENSESSAEDEVTSDDE